MKETDAEALHAQIKAALQPGLRRKTEEAARAPNTAAAARPNARQNASPVASNVSLSVNLGEVATPAPMPAKRQDQFRAGTRSRKDREGFEGDSADAPRGSARAFSKGSRQKSGESGAPNKPDRPKKIRKIIVLDANSGFNQALRWLAGRDYSAAKLREKLRGLEYPDAIIADVLTRLQESSWQSDQRFAEAKIRSLSQRGKGPMAIQQKLSAAGVEKTLRKSSLDAAELDWLKLASETLARKFKTPVADRNDYAKRARFLLSRGFSSGDVSKALKASTAQEGDDD